ncbi:unnamed protein product [Lupinus luteus]|uniref:Uncharacterized protein n=1 Tax=Lupinus luteus TaxID=3873 RepID=A0AAV1VXL6_LUPLU
MRNNQSNSRKMSKTPNTSGTEVGSAPTPASGTHVVAVEITNENPSTKENVHK